MLKEQLEACKKEQVNQDKETTRRALEKNKYIQSPREERGNYKEGPINSPPQHIIDRELYNPLKFIMASY